MIDLFVNEVEDSNIRENFRKLENNLNNEPITSPEWVFVELTFTGAETNYKHKHNLKFTPRDVIQTSITGAGSVTFNYALFDETNIDITTDDACVVRFFLGRYKN